jgi:hypothetical protein
VLATWCMIEVNESPKIAWPRPSQCSVGCSSPHKHNQLRTLQSPESCKCYPRAMTPPQHHAIEKKLPQPCIRWLSQPDPAQVVLYTGRPTHSSPSKHLILQATAPTLLPPAATPPALQAPCPHPSTSCRHPACPCHDYPATLIAQYCCCRRYCCHCQSGPCCC